MAVTQNELITALQTLLSTTDVRLLMRTGTAAQLDLSSLVAGEFAVATDTQEVYCCFGNGIFRNLARGIVIKGVYATLGALQTARPTGTEGDIYAAGSAPQHLYVWTNSTWTDMGAWNDTTLFATDSAVVHKTGNETIAGVKTFSSSPIVPAPTTAMQTATKKYVDDNGSPLSGWKLIAETWAYLSANSVTVPAGATARYQKGDYVMLGQSTTKYFVVTAVADTVLTLTGGSDYAIDNAAITAVYLSRQANPFGFPGEFNYAPTSGGFSVAPTGVAARFSIKGGVCSVSIRQANNGTSNSSGFSVTLPVQAANVAGAQWTAPAMIVDNGAVPTTPGLAVINAASSSIALYINYAGTAFTASGGKRVAAVVLQYAI